MNECCECITEQFVWIASFFEGLVIGILIGKEKQHHQYHKGHDYMEEMEDGFEKGCIDGIWIGESL
jgi:hypothetical protein